MNKGIICNNERITDLLKTESIRLLPGHIYRVEDLKPSEISKKLWGNGVENYSVSFNPEDPTLIVHEMIPDNKYDKNEILEGLVNLSDLLSIKIEGFFNQEIPIFFKGITPYGKDFEDPQSLRNLQCSMIQKKFGETRLGYTDSGILYCKHMMINTGWD